MALVITLVSTQAQGRTYETLEKDHRIMFDSRDFPWRAIGRLNKTTGGFCTASVIANDWVLTAAHCLYNKYTGRYLPASEIHFVAGYQQDRWVAHSAAQRIVTHKKYRPKDHANPKNAINDWALVQLKEPIAHITGTLGVISHKQAIRQSKTVTLIQAGYSRDRAHALTAHAGCRWLGRYKKTNLILHDCDAFEGDSGSPMLAWTESGPSIVGIHVGTFKKSKTGLGGAVTSETILRNAKLPTDISRSASPDNTPPPRNTIHRILKHLGYHQKDKQERIQAWSKDHGHSANMSAEHMIHTLFAHLRRKSDNP